MFLIGIYSSFKKPKNSFLVVWLLIMALPGILTYEGVPHSLRSIGTIPAAYILAALGAQYLYSWFNNKLKNKKTLNLLCFLFLIFLIFAQFNKYFIDWSQNLNTQNSFSKDYVYLGNYLNSLPADTQKYVIVNTAGVLIPLQDGIPMSAQTIMFVERTKWNELRTRYLRSDQIDEIQTNNQNTIIVPMQYDTNILVQFQERFPQGTIQTKHGILIFNIPKKN